MFRISDCHYKTSMLVEIKKFKLYFRLFYFTTIEMHIITLMEDMFWHRSRCLCVLLWRETEVLRETDLSNQVTASHANAGNRTKATLLRGWMVNY